MTISLKFLPTKTLTPSSKGSAGTSADFKTYFNLPYVQSSKNYMMLSAVMSLVITNFLISPPSGCTILTDGTSAAFIPI